MAKPVKRSIAKKSLLQKGFIQDKGDHEFFYFLHSGKTTSAWTKLSRKPGGSDIFPNLFKFMKRDLQLRYDGEVEALLNCEMDHEGYTAKLLEYNVISGRNA